MGKKWPSPVTNVSLENNFRSLSPRFCPSSSAQPMLPGPSAAGQRCAHQRPHEKWQLLPSEEFLPDGLMFLDHEDVHHPQPAGKG